MAFDFDIIYVKGNTIPHVDTLSKLRFQRENGEEHENSEDTLGGDRRTISQNSQQRNLTRPDTKRDT